MQNKIFRLLDIQILDIKIRDLNRKKESFETSLNEQSAAFSTHRDTYEKEKAKLVKIQTEIKSSEIEIESLQQKKKKLEEHQAAVKTNQEYKALSKEILDVCADVDKYEELYIKKMDELDGERKRLELHSAKLKEEEAKLKEETLLIEDSIKNISHEISELESERKKVIPDIDPSMIRVYQKVFARTGGPAVVPVNNRSCGGCHLSITAQVENMTRRNEELILCENCSRILYYRPDDVEEEAEGKS